MAAGINALLVENNRSDAQIFEQLIDSSELIKPTLHHADRFDGAIAALQESPFDIILLNLCLPDGEGVNLVKQLRSRIPQTPVIAVNDLSDPATAVLAIQEGAQDYLVKKNVLDPVRLKSLGYREAGNLLITTLQYAIERAELTKALEVSQQRYELAVKGANDGIWDWDLRSQTIYYSERWQSLLGLSYELVNDSPHFWFSRIHPDDRAQFQQQLTGHLRKEIPQFQCEHRLLHDDGSYRWMLSRGIALWNEQGRAYRIAGSQTDITDRKTLENSLYQEKELAQITLHSIGDAVITTDEQGRIKDLNPIAEQLTGWQRQAAKYRPVAEVCNIVDGNSRQQLKNPAIQAIEKGTAVSLSNDHPVLISKKGQEFAIGNSAAPIWSTSGKIVGTVLVFHDVTEERGRAKQLAWQASHDPLTQLHNRAKFQQSLSEVVEDAHIRQSHHVLCCMDLDHFKIVNDTCGHAAGDLLLKQIADLCRSKIRISDTLARLGGDEFGLILYDCDLASALNIANSICNSIRSFRFVYDQNVFHIGASIGVVPVTKHTDSTEGAMRLADSACYSAKNKGRNRVQVYHQNNREIARNKIDGQWVSQLTDALENNQFRLYKQIILASQKPSEMAKSIAEPAIELCEILLRFEDSSSGDIVPPMAFLPTAERYKLMPRIDRWVVEHLLSKLSEQPSRQLGLNSQALNNLKAELYTVSTCQEPASMTKRLWSLSGSKWRRIGSLHRVFVLRSQKQLRSRT